MSTDTRRVMYPVTPEGYVELPIHEYNPGSKSCKFCGLEPIWDSYQEYVEHWYAKEFEGTIVESDGYVWTPQPESEEMYLYVASTCTGSYIFDKHAEFVS